MQFFLFYYVRRMSLFTSQIYEQIQTQILIQTLIQIADTDINAYNVRIVARNAIESLSPESGLWTPDTGISHPSGSRS